MSRRSTTTLALMPAHFVGLGTIQLAALLSVLSPNLMPWALAVGAVVLGVSCAVPSWRLYGPQVRCSRQKRLALGLSLRGTWTPRSLQELLSCLREKKVGATVFLTPVQASDLALLRTLVTEKVDFALRLDDSEQWRFHFSTRWLSACVARCHAAAPALGLKPLALLAPAHRTGPGWWPALLQHGVFALHADHWLSEPSCGWTADTLKRVLPRSGLLMVELSAHEPAEATRQRLNEWIEPLAERARADGLWETVSSAIGRPVLAPIHETTDGTVESFYDGLAAKYEGEQHSSGQSHLRGIEQRVVQQMLGELLCGTERVLELGAGTGLFTAHLFGKGRQVVAVDVSAQMLAVLRERAQALGFSELTTKCGDMTRLAFDGPYDLVCSFSAFEYAADLPSLLASIASSLRPGGMLYFTTAHRGPLRLFTQVGNAMRQGLWLHARSVSEISAMCRANGFEVVSVKSHGLSLPLFGGMLLEVLARRDAGLATTDASARCDLLSGEPSASAISLTKTSARGNAPAPTGQTPAALASSGAS